MCLQKSSSNVSCIQKEFSVFNYIHIHGIIWKDDYAFLQGNIPGRHIRPYIYHVSEGHVQNELQIKSTSG